MDWVAAMAGVQRVVLSALVLVALFVLARVTERTTHSAEIQRLEAVGYRAARYAAMRRTLAALALDSARAAARRSDSTAAAARAAIARVAASAFHGVGPTHVDSAPRVVLGSAGPTDTLIALPYARVALAALADTAQAVLAAVTDAARLERGRLNTAVRRLSEAIAAQDTVIAAKDTVIALLRDARPRWVARATGGVLHALAGVSCGAIGWALANPLTGLGAGVACAAVAGVLR